MDIQEMNWQPTQDEGGEATLDLTLHFKADESVEIRSGDYNETFRSQDEATNALKSVIEQGYRQRQSTSS